MSGNVVGKYVDSPDHGFAVCALCAPRFEGHPITAEQASWEDRCDHCGRNLIWDLEAHMAKTQSELTAYVLANADLDRGVGVLDQ